MSEEANNKYDTNECTLRKSNPQADLESQVFERRLDLNLFETDLVLSTCSSETLLERELVISHLLHPIPKDRAKYRRNTMEPQKRIQQTQKQPHCDAG